MGNAIGSRNNDIHPKTRADPALHSIGTCLDCGDITDLTHMNTSLTNGTVRMDPPMIQNEPYFTQADYDEFQALIETKMAEARATLDLLHQTLLLDRSNGTDDTYASSNIQEDGQATLEREEAARMADRQEKFIQQLQAALIRIQNKTYGICRSTGKPIAKERLRVVPHATLSMEAKTSN